MHYTIKCLVAHMSNEKKFISEINNLHPYVTPEKSNEVSASGRVDINILLNRARKVKEKETITNLVFIGLTLSLIFVVGIILSF
ncbi:hypothetical protein N8925_00995 [Candidatus Pelagibacter sp.]|nr:hypothetical protein [Candidatus Pelagibacter sp.]